MSLARSPSTVLVSVGATKILSRPQRTYDSGIREWDSGLALQSDSAWALLHPRWLCDAGEAVHQSVLPAPHLQHRAATVPTATRNTMPGTRKPPVNIRHCYYNSCVWNAFFFCAARAIYCCQGCSWPLVRADRYKASGWSPSQKGALGTSVSGVPWPQLHLKQPGTTNPLMELMISFLN